MKYCARFAFALAFMLGLTQLASAEMSHSIFAYSHDSSYITQLELVTSSGTTTQQYVDRGWYNETGVHLPTNPNYLAGINGSSDENFGDDLEYRNWFLFQIPQLGTDVYTAATLKLYVPIPDGYISPNSSLTYKLYDVTTDPGALANATGGIAAFNDLGTGAQFGEIVATDASEGTILSISLNAAALASLNTPLSSLWGIGGAVQPVPEPSSAMLAMMAALVVAVIARFRRRVH
jgi:hypothetical protein